MKSVKSFFFFFIRVKCNTQLLANDDFSPQNNTKIAASSSSSLKKQTNKQSKNVNSTLQTFVWATLIIKKLHKILMNWSRKCLPLSNYY